MARKKYASETEEAKVDMTPLLDIVFIMLIFFIVTTSFVKPMGVEYSVPESNTPNNSQKSDNILISIEKSGLIKIGDRLVDIERVTANIQQIRAEAPEASVLILAETEARHGLVVKVMDYVKIAGVQKVSVAEKKKG
ncbi:biopolymer transporter ExbD [Shewanella submarina]|uniref:ExbD/TolR family protein n=1 Tax=Shewanella submarina TaxID=2016376 RepID=A0ABV7GBT1_9GAMM|nr:biopolymer transporter ExbD [Shewanella submarina]MCL1038929.1 biopolymer transporter ExbD [Shewanella submarina]